MRIQSVQNQQTQSRPNFTAHGSIEKKLAGLLEGLEIGSPVLHLEDGSPEVIKVLERLSKAFKDFFGVNGVRVSADGANQRHFATTKGDRAIVEKSLYKEDGEKPIGLIVRQSDGSETRLIREDIYFCDEKPTPTDTLFDKTAKILDKKAVRPKEITVIDDEQRTTHQIVASTFGDNSAS